MDPSKYRPVEGKTYSLFGEGGSTGGFYHTISTLTDETLRRFSFSEIQLLEFTRTASRNKGKLRRAHEKRKGESKLVGLMGIAHTVLEPYMTGIDEHLSASHLRKLLTDRELLTTREQYYLYMLEFEMVNRISMEDFRSGAFKIALLPYCLKENHLECKAKPDEIDYRCSHCLKNCYINRISRKLREHDIAPYILSRGRISSLLKKLKAEHGNIGVLGIACLVELVMGMRLCLQAEIPVLGLPLNANRCPRWMGTIHDTSIDLPALDNLLTFRE